MAGDRKSREEIEKKKTKQSTSSIRKRSASPTSSASEDEGRSRKRSRKEEKKKSKDGKSRSHRSDKVGGEVFEKQSKDKHKAKHQKGDVKPRSDFQELSADDYFAKNNEFATWLKEKKKVFFSDLSADSAREYFTRFVKAWNNQKLDSRYYDGISSGPRTAHNWQIRN